MKEIHLTKGKVTLVDDEDYEYLRNFTWRSFIRKHGVYVVTSYRDEFDKVKVIYMHRLLMDTPKEMVCDHIDRNPLNNQRSNLRNCTYKQNSQNRVLSFKKPPSSKYTGVQKCRKNTLYYFATIIQNNFIGYFPNTLEGEIAAAKAYDAEAIKRYGEFAVLNFKKEPD